MKEWTWDIWITLSLNKVPVQILIEIILFVVLWLNAFPPDSRIHQTYYPREIIMDRNLGHTKHFRVYFGTYAETHDDATPTKTVAERSKEAIFLGPT